MEVIKNQPKPTTTTTKFDTLKRQKRAIKPGREFEYPALQKLSEPHIESFNRIFEASGKNQESLVEIALGELGKRVIHDMKVDEGVGKYGNKLTYWIEDVQLMRPSVQSRGGQFDGRLEYPAECRERNGTYRGRMTAKVCWQVNDSEEVHSEIKSLGQAPIMVKSNRCNLNGMGPSEHIKHHEEAEEFGGYFVVNGGERIIRLLIAPRRNHVLAVNRPSYENRGPSFTGYATMVRSVRKDQTSCTTTLHYLKDGNLQYRFAMYKQEYLIPVILIIKALAEVSDLEIFEGLMQGRNEDTVLRGQVEQLIRGLRAYKVHNQKQSLKYLGSKFRVVMGMAEDASDEEIGRALIRRVVMVHLDNWRDKLQMALFMVRKLYGVVAGEWQTDNLDALQNQELYMPGFLYLGIIKEKLEDILNNVRAAIRQDLMRNAGMVRLGDKGYISRVLKKVQMDVGAKLQYFLATGNLISRSGMDMQQTSGFTVIAEKLNFLRYLSHFQCVHRGSFFAELKTTTVRKLLPESWGFLCPVHTPDGSPCGLLNHLAHKCEPTTRIEGTRDVERVIYDSGMSVGQSIYSRSNSGATAEEIVVVQVDGKVLGYCTQSMAETIAKRLRQLKNKQNNSNNKLEYRLPKTLEIGYVPVSHGGQYPGLYIFSTPARFMRPVRHLQTNSIELVGSFEQVYMDIAILNQDIIEGVSEYIEILPTHILSSVANLTPFCDFNQSPRNMYQCQMGKQSMGTPAQSVRHRADNKLYWLQNTQTPIVRPSLHDKFGVDGYPNGMNAVVAVLAYTGYDMEDAMILNKSSFERGFGYGFIYKSQIFDLAELRRRGDPITNHFGLGSDVIANNHIRSFIDLDGLPHIGVSLSDGDPVVAVFDDVRNKTFVRKYKGEPCYVDTVRLACSSDPELQHVVVTYRIPRSPIIGDKFSSRHGQKGVNSIKYSAVDLPFTESGLQPDVIVNPHAFPSRMTIGMFVESLAGKSGALHGIPQDATPFQFDENNSAADYFGSQLLRAGYNYHGNEPMYSGISGNELAADIYIGVVYYQRLRHMVSDKYQVRTTGPVDPLTMQPVKGRKKGGGIRLGEMERDSLLAHGSSFILQDRLLNCSDYSKLYVCKSCGSLLAPILLPSSSSSSTSFNDSMDPDLFSTLQSAAASQSTSSANLSYNNNTFDVFCKSCTSSNIGLVAVPFVLKFLATELASMNIKLVLSVS
ncbi:putative DNA-directed RNA polymerase I subunit RPA2 [Zancudomyces culisetae]|uniref:DNA-directed RNA polymerase subunit beta n=1 Tax=Zancudomyces culisetae TaxID=1213189 RepID=A0A1R1PWD4_ZANCU|nr:putative DNA-directed RNA polymerase I subunit RPA2 [Zancudomyces culisetae]|eukprot:OMH85234.1 putative DNA-directed RNA polymerase I subunit RPA2 [Zancudomyces culisetae]